MFGAHLPELAIVMMLALVVFGPKRLPEIGSALGRGIRDFRKGVSHLDDSSADHEVAEVAPATVTVPQRHEVA